MSDIFGEMADALQGRKSVRARLDRLEQLIVAFVDNEGVYESGLVADIRAELKAARERPAVADLTGGESAA